MNKVTSSLLQIIGVLLMVFVGSAGALNVAIQLPHGMNHTGVSPAVRCQASCNVAVATSTVTSRKFEEEQDEGGNFVRIIATQLDLFAFRFIKKFTSASELYRLLRPPDLYALNSSYRF